MASNTFREKSSPHFDNQKENYSKWKRKFSLQEDITKVDKNKKGSLVVLWLDGETQESVLDTVSKEGFKNEKAAAKVIAHLNTIF